MLVVYFLCLIAFSRAGRDSITDLTADRLVTAEKWIIRTHSLADLNAVYTDTYTDSSLSHLVSEAGGYAPREVAYEYDALATIVTQLLGFQLIIVNTVWDKSTTQFVSTDVLRVDFIVFAQVMNFTSFQYTDLEGFRFTEYIHFLPNSKVMDIGFTHQDIDAARLFDLITSTVTSEAVCGIIIAACNVSTGVGNNTYLPDTSFATFSECVTFLNDLPSQPCPFPQRSNTSACRNLHALNALALPNIHCVHVKRESMVCESSCLPTCANCHANAECIGDFSNIPSSFAPIYK